MKRLSLPTLSILILCAALWSGCGFFARFGLDKQVAKVEEAKQKAVQAEANRYAAGQFRLAETAYRDANQLKEQGKYKEAKEQLAQAVTLYERAAQMAPAGKAAFEQSAAAVAQSLEEVRALLEQARAAGAEQTAPQIPAWGCRPLKTWAPPPRGAPPPNLRPSSIWPPPADPSTPPAPWPAICSRPPFPPRSPAPRRK